VSTLASVCVFGVVCVCVACCIDVLASAVVLDGCSEERDVIVAVGVPTLLVSSNTLCVSGNADVCVVVAMCVYVCV